MKTDVRQLQQTIDDMANAQQKLFRSERFIGSEHDFRLYTGFPDFATFQVFFDYLLPACNNLIYYGYPNDTEIVVSVDEHIRIQGVHEHYLQKRNCSCMVLVRLRCGLLVED